MLGTETSEVIQTQSCLWELLVLDLDSLGPSLVSATEEECVFGMKLA